MLEKKFVYRKTDEASKTEPFYNIEELLDLSQRLDIYANAREALYDKKEINESMQKIVDEMSPKYEKLTNGQIRDEALALLKEYHEKRDRQ